MPTRPPRSLVPGESQVSDELGDRPRGPWREISGRSTGSQNPGQFDEHEERKFTGIRYDALLTSTAGWGSSAKQESDADRPNPAAAKFEFDNDEDIDAFADRRDEEENLARRSARSRAAARPRSLSRGAVRDLRVDRDTRSERERARDTGSSSGFGGHDRSGSIGPPAFDHTPNVPPFPNITFGGPLHQRGENANRVTGSPRITERVAEVVETGARDGGLANVLGIEDRPSIASPLGRDPSDLELLRSSNEFTPQRGSAAREVQLRRMRKCSIPLMFISTLLLNLVHRILTPNLAIAGEGDPP